MSSLIIANLIIRRTIGNRKSLIMLMLLPILIISGIVGMFGKSSEAPAQIAVLNQDRSWLSEPVMSAIVAVDEYEVIEQDPKTAKSEQLQEDVYAGKWDAFVHIPAGFTAQMLSGETTSVELYRKNEQQWNASLAITLTEATERLARTVQLAAVTTEDKTEQEKIARDLLLEQDKGKVNLIKEKPLPRYSDAHILVIGLMLMFIMILVNQSIHGIMEDRGNRTMARVFSTPVRAWEIALGNFLGCVMLGTIQLAFILGSTRYIIGFDFGVSFGILFIIMECFLLAAVGISSATAGMVKNTASLGSINNLIVIPTCMLGGCFWPVSMMAEFMQKLSNFTPQRWAIAALDQASITASFSDIALNLGVLLLFALVLLAFGSYVLRPAQS